MKTFVLLISLLIANLSHASEADSVGKWTLTPIRNAYATTNVTTSAYVQLAATTSAGISEIVVYDSSGQTLALAVGKAGSEVVVMNITPNMTNIRMPVRIPLGSRIAVKAITANATTGELDINLFQ